MLDYGALSQVDDAAFDFFDRMSFFWATRTFRNHYERCILALAPFKIFVSVGFMNLLNERLRSLYSINTCDMEHFYASNYRASLLKCLIMTILLYQTSLRSAHGLRARILIMAKLVGK